MKKKTTSVNKTTKTKEKKVEKPLGERKHIVMFSGGIGSWACAKRVAERHGTKNMILLFTDTKSEDEDLYRFLYEASANIGAKLVCLEEGRDLWQLFYDMKFLSNSLIDNCSHYLKRRPAKKWLKENCDKTNTTIYVGIDWTEIHRFERLKEIKDKEGWTYEAPMTEAPYLEKNQMLEMLKKEGIKPPRLYSLGFAHNNCGGFCVKAGQGHFANLLKKLPERYKYHEEREQQFREDFNKDVAFMKKTVDGKNSPYTLRELRLNIEANKRPDLFDVGGCGCFIDVPDESDDE